MIYRVNSRRWGWGKGKMKWYGNGVIKFSRDIMWTVGCMSIA